HGGGDKVSLRGGRHADRVHVMRPNHEADHADGDHCIGHAEIAEDRLAREGRDDLARHAEARKDQDVDFRMAEEPEQMLEQDRIAKSTAGPGWPEVESGAYSVQPPPTPGAPGSPSTNSEVTSNAKEAGSSQNEMLFMRGKAMSGAPIISGTIQLPNPPIIAGM